MLMMMINITFVVTIVTLMMIIIIEERVATGKSCWLLLTVSAADTWHLGIVGDHPDDDDCHHLWNCQLLLTVSAADTWHLMHADDDD